MTRLVWLVVAVAALAILITARMLTPSASGYGTHVALGLPPCGFRSWAGLPCPTCGLTTGFALLARGELLAAIRVHPTSVPLFLATLAALGVALRGFVRSDSILLTIDRLQLDRWALLLVISLLTTWLASLGLDVLAAR